MDTKEPIILIGEDNPFSKFCGSIFYKINDSLLCVVGPIRMDYKKARECLKRIKI